MNIDFLNVILVAPQGSIVGPILCFFNEAFYVIETANAHNL